MRKKIVQKEREKGMEISRVSISDTATTAAHYLSPTSFFIVLNQFAIMVIHSVLLLVGFVWLMAGTTTSVPMSPCYYTEALKYYTTKAPEYYTITNAALKYYSAPSYTIRDRSTTRIRMLPQPTTPRLPSATLSSAKYYFVPIYYTEGLAYYTPEAFYFYTEAPKYYTATYAAPRSHRNTKS
ncbi:uncharacterized protein LOC124311936 [Daphnia pulicaria]|uniref:uncharacterized protein LOC124311936 n=1 Tax=Daphnia pulicaria TaxID=35523 RepID=UPI001EEC22EB|nr:uncharacterized protein LOC124311936 [Daphnia pulicaria]